MGHLSVEEKTLGLEKVIIFGTLLWNQLIGGGRESLGNNYVICRSYCVASLPDTYDLYDNPEHIVSFRALSEALSEEYPNKFISVHFFLEMLKAHSDFLKEFKAIRAKAERCWKDVPRLKFNRGNVAYLETIPPIQFCVLDKSYLINGEYQIIYPPKYLVEGVVQVFVMIP